MMLPLRSRANETVYGLVTHYIEVVNAGEKEKAGAGGLRQPPRVPKKAVLAALHMAGGVIQRHGPGLNRSVDSGRLSEGPHERIIFVRPGRDRLARRVRVEGGGAVLRD